MNNYPLRALFVFAEAESLPAVNKRPAQITDNFPTEAGLQHEKAVSPLQAGFGVSSRKFKRAVDRNRIKRLMREAYRTNKTPLRELLILRNQCLLVFVTYTGKDIEPLDHIQAKMGEVVQTLIIATERQAKQNPRVS